MSGGRGPGVRRRIGRAVVPDIPTLRALYHGSLARRLLFLKTTTPPPFGTAFELLLSVVQPPAEIRLSAVVRFVADGNAPKGSGCGVELGETKEEIASRLAQVGISLDANDTSASKVQLEVVFEAASAGSSTSAPTVSQAPPAVAAQTPHSRVALVVEDDVELQRMYQRILEPAGFHVLIAKDGAQGLELFSKNQVVLMVVDYLLPRLDGLKMLEKTFEARKVPVIFSSAMARDAQMVARLKALGVQWILEKPFRLDYLRKAFDQATQVALESAR